MKCFYDKPWSLGKRKLPPFAAAIGDEIPNDETAEVIQRRKISPPVIEFCQAAHEILKVRIIGDHESGDRDFFLAANDSLIERPVDYYGIKADRITIELTAGPGYHRGLAVGDHENLLVFMFLLEQYLSGEAECCLGICMVWSDRQIGKIAYFYFSGIITKSYYMNAVFIVILHDKFGKRQRNIFSRCDSILTI